MFSLEGRIALVTGARTGIGRALAVGLAAAGADIVLHGRDDDLDKVEAEVRKTGRQASRWVLDLSDPRAVPEAAGRLGPVDVLVNNAGIIRRAPAAEHSHESFREVLDVNLDAVFLLSQVLGARMLARGSGKIIMIASMLSFQGGVNVVGYTAAKHGVAGLTRALACEWAGSGVQVNAIAAGHRNAGQCSGLQAGGAGGEGPRGSAR
ncbi:SDR family NAD(P)-dependent oxidoreductase [Streptosporangium sp. H16]|uniref:SDR family NAD(P)-dependent oxidoreductase n=1 Tax=Streptosporangium sp. H16 TaxID=3444184 RepID=UPI003F7A5E4C